MNRSCSTCTRLPSASYWVSRLVIVCGRADSGEEFGARSVRQGRSTAVSGLLYAGDGNGRRRTVVPDRPVEHWNTKPLFAGRGRHLAVILAAETYCRSPLTPRSKAIRDRLKEQDQQGAVDAQLQAEWNRLHQRSIYLDSMVLVGGLCLLGIARRFSLP